MLCPRRCGVNRREGKRGYCGENAELRIAAAVLHHGEEPPLTGNRGSGTVFVSGCTLGCVFCQNWQISQDGMGTALTEAEFVRICLELQARGAANINLVTGSHAAPALAAGIAAAKTEGLALPVLWNSSAYESAAALDLLADTVDVYLPDLKTLDCGTARRFFRAPDYPGHAVRAVLTMMDQRTLRFAEASPAGPGTPAGSGSVPALLSGVVIRHLVLPGHLGSTREALRWFARYAQGRALLSLMMQYTPAGREVLRTGSGETGPVRAMNRREYETVLGWLEEFGIEDGFCQELVSGGDWLPDFRRENPFGALADPVWHWAKEAVL
jgi:putative pyruvate formate lyase activating enzyme